jgi:hypothetical protein
VAEFPKNDTSFGPDYRPTRVTCRDPLRPSGTHYALKVRDGTTFDQLHQQWILGNQLGRIMSQVNTRSMPPQSDETKARPVEAELVMSQSPRDRLEQLRQIARLLDSQFRIPGANIEFGVDALISLIPGVGDLISAAISSWLIHEARRLGAPWWLIARMIWNVAVDGVIGIVPIVGDAFDVVWKANRKNIALLTKYLEHSKTQR